MSKALTSNTGFPSHRHPGLLPGSKSGASIMRGNMALNQDFKEFSQSLNDNDVRYLVIGGYAVAFHGYPRYAKDIDIWIDIDEQNVTKVARAGLDNVSQ